MEHTHQLGSDGAHPSAQKRSTQTTRKENLSRENNVQKIRTSANMRVRVKVNKRARAHASPRHMAHILSHNERTNDNSTPTCRRQRASITSKLHGTDLGSSSEEGSENEGKRQDTHHPAAVQTISSYAADSRKPWSHEKRTASPTGETKCEKQSRSLFWLRSAQRQFR